MTDSPKEYLKSQHDQVESKIAEMTEDELWHFIQKHPTDVFCTLVRDEFRKRKQEEKIFTTTQSWIITIATVVLATCEFIKLIRDLS